MLRNGSPSPDHSRAVGIPALPPQTVPARLPGPTTVNSAQGSVVFHAAVHAGRDDPAPAHRHEMRRRKAEIALGHELAVDVEDLPAPPAGVQGDNLAPDGGNGRDDGEFPRSLAVAADRADKPPVVVEDLESGVAVQHEVAEFFAIQDAHAISLDHAVAFGIAEAHDLVQREFGGAVAARPEVAPARRFLGRRRLGDPEQDQEQRPAWYAPKAIRSRHARQ